MVAHVNGFYEEAKNFYTILFKKKLLEQGRFVIMTQLHLEIADTITQGNCEGGLL